MDAPYDRRDTLPRLARAIRALPPSCGPVRLVAVDGHAGSGKSTFAAGLAAALGGAPVLHLDDLATHEEHFGWAGRLRSQVLEPFGRGEPARYGVYDWHRRAFTGTRELPAADVVLVEGVGAGRRAVRPHTALLLWMEYEQQSAWERGRLRDGPAQHPFWEAWMPGEREHFAADPSRPYADLLVFQDESGYWTAPGPAVAA
ncbi:hypothetical protein G5C51_15420 [Streptomyces sp. A7024]|uniref:Uridine kinase n=1 Tax=Streptomyces coryli TaxID=1128680 RepID=A0A6G4TZG2_9ACTN|nr:hypothetical protein [Streptomyces coryli]NGN65284.1 hypothetical protein [Streptomyces coryli]